MNLVHDIAPGEMGESVNTIIEIPKGSALKIEYDIEKAIFFIDRVEPDIFAKPVSYGFIPGTLDGDGDPLDTLVIASEPIGTGILVNSRVIGILNFEDGGEVDHKIICVPTDDRNSGDKIKDLSDLDDTWKAKIEYHFNHYKDLKKPGTTHVAGWDDSKAAWDVIKECIERYKAKYSK